jgi:hypothetical protein
MGLEKSLIMEENYATTVGEYRMGALIVEKEHDFVPNANSPATEAFQIAQLGPRFVAWEPGRSRATSASLAAC